MKISLKYLLFNRYVFLAGLLLIVISFLSWAVSSEFFSALFFWDVSEMGLTKREYLDMIYPFHNYPVQGFTILQAIIPVFSGLIIIPFLRTKNLFCYVYSRGVSYKGFILKKIFQHLIIGCTFLFLAYIVFLAVGASFLKIEQSGDISRVLFVEILGRNFVNEHTFLFFVIDGFLKYFVFCFVYGLFSISISFMTSKNYLCVLIPIIYYIGLDIIIAVLNFVVPFDIFFLSPAYTLMSSTRAYINSFVLLAPLLPPLLFSVIIILKDLVGRRKRNDAFSIA